jgi:hypothetical protein
MPAPHTQEHDMTTTIKTIHADLSMYAERAWDDAQHLGGNDFAVYLTDGGYGLHIGDTEDADGNVTTTYTVVHAEDGCEAGAYSTYRTIGRAISAAEAIGNDD